VIDELQARNIGTSVHFIPVHLHPIYAQRLATRGVIFLSPSGVRPYPVIAAVPRMTQSDVADVISAVRGVIEPNTR